MDQGKHSLSLCMIVKNGADKLPTLWASVKNIVDEWILVDTGSTDDTAKVAAKLGARVIKVGDKFCDTLTKEHVDFFKTYGVEVTEGQKVFHFGKARTFSFEQATKDFILWLDADDILIGSQKLQDIIKANLDTTKNLGIHLLYHYEMDKYGSPIVAHYRERVVPNNKGFHRWTGRIHELIVPEYETQYLRVVQQDSYVLHNHTAEEKKSSGNRNTVALLLDLFEQGKNSDPRTLYQLGESFSISGRVDVSIDLYKRYLEKSGWDEERCVVCCRLVEMYLYKKDYSQALEWAYRAMKERPDFPCSYSFLAQTYYALDDQVNTIKFAHEALRTEQPDTMVFVNEKNNKFTPLCLLADAYLSIGSYKEALSCAVDGLKIEPLNDTLKKIQFTASTILTEIEQVQKIVDVIEYHKTQGELLKALKILNNSAISIKKHPKIVSIKKTLKEEIEKRSIAVSSPRLKKEDAVGEEFKLLVADLKKFDCKTVHLISREKLLESFLKKNGFTLTYKDEEVDAVVFDWCIQYDLKLLIHADKARKLVAVTLPFKSTTNNISFDIETLNNLLQNDNFKLWNNIALQNGVIYASTLRKDVRKKITFFCGDSCIEPFGPFSHLDGGVGGSEEAVIYLSRELVNQGYTVEVINTFPHACVVDGVTWRHFSSVEEDEQFDQIVLWRIPHYIDEYNLHAKNIILWLHDVPEKHWFTKERIEKIDKIVVLSNYHRSLLPFIQDDKFLISQNGVDLKQFLCKDVERNLHKIIYTSSYDRGLEHLLNNWEEVKKEVPEAELHIFYGWGNFDKLRSEETKRQWKSMMIEKMSTLRGVFEHGRIAQDQLAVEMLSSSIYAYPCHFEEISCISAMKGQVAGCIPLTTDYAALAETNATDFVVKGNPRDAVVEQKFVKQLIDRLKNPITEKERKRIIEDARKKFSWTTVAQSWSQNLFS